MSGQWLVPEQLYSIDEKVRVEIGPQIIELDCTDANLSNDVTHPMYQRGKRDSYGEVIGEGAKMHCVDWREKLAPALWKVYEFQETEELDHEGNPISRFVKVDEKEDKDEAVALAEALAGGLN
jgi:hypothetical protein